ncbi:C2H2-type domain-containing protein [Aphelenchoides fujianensis]|nr:C2H2-type domain-containing protein [Aphelenchoides fujianensis]
MTEGPQSKKRALWNPGLDEPPATRTPSRETKTPPVGSSFANCLQMLASMQQASQTPHVSPFPARFLPFPFAHLLNAQRSVPFGSFPPINPTVGKPTGFPPLPPIFPPMAAAQFAHSRPPPPARGSKGGNRRPSRLPPSTGNNPIVDSVLSSSSNVNFNCCAVCGASFRLTSDLVQHVRNNHRSSRYKRKLPAAAEERDDEQ